MIRRHVFVLGMTICILVIVVMVLNRSQKSSPSSSFIRTNIRFEFDDEVLRYSDISTYKFRLIDTDSQMTVGEYSLSKNQLGIVFVDIKQIPIDHYEAKLVNTFDPDHPKALLVDNKVRFRVFEPAALKVTIVQEQVPVEAP